MKKDKIKIFKRSIPLASLLEWFEIEAKKEKYGIVRKPRIFMSKENINIIAKVHGEGYEKSRKNARRT